MPPPRQLHNKNGEQDGHGIRYSGKKLVQTTRRGTFTLSGWATEQDARECYAWLKRFKGNGLTEPTAYHIALHTGDAQKSGWHIHIGISFSNSVKFQRIIADLLDGCPKLPGKIWMDSMRGSMEQHADYVRNDAEEYDVIKEKVPDADSVDGEGEDGGKRGYKRPFDAMQLAQEFCGQTQLSYKQWFLMKAQEDSRILAQEKSVERGIQAIRDVDAEKFLRTKVLKKSKLYSWQAKIDQLLDTRANERHIL